MGDSASLDCLSSSFFDILPQAPEYDTLLLGLPVLLDACFVSSYDGLGLGSASLFTNSAKSNFLYLAFLSCILSSFSSIAAISSSVISLFFSSLAYSSLGFDNYYSLVDIPNFDFFTGPIVKKSFISLLGLSNSLLKADTIEAL